MPPSKATAPAEQVDEESTPRAQPSQLNRHPTTGNLRPIFTTIQDPNWRYVDFTLFPFDPTSSEETENALPYIKQDSISPEQPLETNFPQTTPTQAGGAAVVSFNEGISPNQQSGIAEPRPGFLAIHLPQGHIEMRQSDYWINASDVLGAAGFDGGHMNEVFEVLEKQTPLQRTHFTHERFIGFNPGVHLIREVNLYDAMLPLLRQNPNFVPEEEPSLDFLSGYIEVNGKNIIVRIRKLDFRVSLHQLAADTNLGMPLPDGFWDSEELPYDVVFEKCPNTGRESVENWYIPFIDAIDVCTHYGESHLKNKLEDEWVDLTMRFASQH